MKKINLIKNGDVVELTQNGDYIVDGKKYTVNIEDGKVILKYICKSDDIDAKILPAKLSLYNNSETMESPSTSKKPRRIEEYYVHFEDKDDCYFCLNEEDKNKILYIKNKNNQYIDNFSKLCDAIDDYFKRKIEKNESGNVYIALGNSNSIGFSLSADNIFTVGFSCDTMNKLAYIYKDLFDYILTKSSVKDFDKGLSFYRSKLQTTMDVMHIDIDFLNNFKYISLYTANIKLIIELLIISKFSKFKRLSFGNDLFLNINHTENDDGSCKKTLSIKKSRFSDVRINSSHIEDIVKAINSIYVDDMEEFLFKDENENLIKKYFILGTNYKNIKVEELLFENKGFHDECDNVYFDEVDLDFEICEELKSLPIFNNANLTINTKECATDDFLETIKYRAENGLNLKTGEFHFTIHPERLVDYPNQNIFTDGNAVYERGVYVKCTLEQYKKVKPYVNAPKVIISDKVMLPCELFADVNELVANNYGVYMYGTGFETPNIFNGTNKSVYELFYGTLGNYPTARHKENYAKTLLMELNKHKHDIYSKEYYTLDYSGFVGKDKDFLYMMFGGISDVVTGGYLDSINETKQILLYNKLSYRFINFENKKSLTFVDGTYFGKFGGAYFAKQNGKFCTAGSYDNTTSETRVTTDANPYKWINEQHLYGLQFLRKTDNAYSHSQSHYLVLDQIITYSGVEVTRKIENAEQKLIDNFKNSFECYVAEIDGVDHVVNNQEKYETRSFYITYKYNEETKKYDIHANYETILEIKLVKKIQFAGRYSERTGVEPYESYGKTWYTYKAYEVSKGSCEIKDLDITILNDCRATKKPQAEKGKVVYTLTKKPDGIIEITWVNGGDIDPKLLTINGQAVPLNQGGN